MKIPTGYYDSPARLGIYLEKEFAKNLPIKGHEELSSCQMHTLSDYVTQMISISTMSLVYFRMITLNERLITFGAVCKPGENKIFIMTLIVSGFDGHFFTNKRQCIFTAML